jgi:hypothetical protein
MKSSLLASTLLLFALGCPSKDSQSSSGSTSPSGASTGTGPLANLESAPFVNEVWIAQDGGQQAPFIYYTQQNVRLSAGCRNGGGQLLCDALKALRSGNPVELPRRSLTGGISAGTRACQKLGNRLWTGRSAQGSEDGFCVFPDGSMVSTGALEQYGMRVTE